MSIISNPDSEIDPTLASIDLHDQLATSERQSVAALTSINRALKLAFIGVQFEFDSKTRTTIANVVNVETGQLIRQMPCEEVMQLSGKLGKLHGLLVHEAICRKARLTEQSQAAAPTRWSSPWVTTDAPGQEAGALRLVKA